MHIFKQKNLTDDTLIPYLNQVSLDPERAGKYIRLLLTNDNN
jgi:hypothetical protein